MKTPNKRLADRALLLSCALSRVEANDAYPQHAGARRQSATRVGMTSLPVLVINMLSTWNVSGPVKTGTLNVSTGKSSEMVDAGYGVRASEPRQFGGTTIIECGLTREQAEAIASIGTP